MPEICVVTTLDRLLDDCCSHGLCETSDGHALTAASLRRMLCDAVVYPTVLGGAGEVLDSGRARRTVNRKQRRALRAMHRTVRSSGLHGAVRVLSHPSRPLVDPRQRPIGHRESVTAL